MRLHDGLQLAALALSLLLTMGPIGRYVARALSAPEPVAKRHERFFSALENRVLRAMGVSPDAEQSWSSYARSVISFTAVSVLAVFVLLRFQGWLPFNPTSVENMDSIPAFNAAVSFVTNTNWQWFAGETGASHLTQMFGFTVQNFMSAAVGIAVAVALIRGFVRRRESTIGNFWVDIVRVAVRVLLPLAFVASLVFASQGVVQNLQGSTEMVSVDGRSTVVVPGGQVASQEAIKQLGTNGGGFYNANSAHPFENPSGLTNFLQMYLMLILPFSLTVTFGVLVGSRRQGRVLLAVMMGFWAAFATLGTVVESGGNPALAAIGINQSPSQQQGGGNMVGKDVRFGSSTCAVFAGSTTGTSTGSTNCSHESMMPLSTAGLMLSMMMGEVSPGGVGMGLVGILINAILAVFIAGLMVGRTPELIGKKIEAAEMKLVVLYVLAVPVVLLGLSSIAVLNGSVTAGLQKPTTHGLGAVLYNFASTTNNNGSSFGFVDVSTEWWTLTTTLAMLAGRFLLIIPVLALAGSLSRKRHTPVTSGTLPTDTPMFGALLAGVVVIVAGLTYFPSLALGPIVGYLS